MSFITKHKQILIGAVILLLLIGGYLMFFSNNASTPNLTSAAPTGTPAQQYFVDLAGELNNLSFNTNVLNDPRFNALVDMHTAILPEASGRPDPFAPITGTSSKK